MKPMLKPPRSKRLRLEHEKVLSNFAFKFNLLRYSAALTARGVAHNRTAGAYTRPLLTST